MAIGSAMQKAAIRLIGRKPNTFFGSSGQFEVELCDLVDEVAKDVAAYQDWQGLTCIHTISGDGLTEDFGLPSDYDRMLIETDVQDLQNWVWGYGYYADINSFLYDKARQAIPLPGGWIIYQDELHFTPAPTGTATFPYISKFYAVDAATMQRRAQFEADTDAFILPERLLTLGLVWRWREQKKLDFTGDQEAFTKALDEYASKDKGSRIIRRGMSVPGNFYRPWPDVLGGA